MFESTHSDPIHSSIWQFHNRNSSYSLSIANLLEKRLSTFALARVTFGTVTFSKELLFWSTYSLNFLSGYCSFWEQLVLKGSIWSIIFFFFFFFIVTFTLHLNVKKLQSPGNLNWYITWENKKCVKNLI